MHLKIFHRANRSVATVHHVALVTFRHETHMDFMLVVIIVMNKEV